MILANESRAALLFVALATMSTACTSKPALRNAQVPVPPAEVFEARGSAIIGREDESDEPSSAAADEPSSSPASAPPKSSK